DKSRYEKIVSQIDDAVSKGANIATGAKYDVDEVKDSYFVHPTVLTNVTDNMDIMNFETFGPVAPITTFNEIEEVIKKANNTPYGLAAYFFTEDYRTAEQL